MLHFPPAFPFFPQKSLLLIWKIPYSETVGEVWLIFDVFDPLTAVARQTSSWNKLFRNNFTRNLITYNLISKILELLRLLKLLQVHNLSKSCHEHQNLLQLKQKLKKLQKRASFVSLNLKLFKLYRMNISNEILSHDKFTKLIRKYTELNFPGIPAQGTINRTLIYQYFYSKITLFIFSFTDVSSLW